VNDTRTRPPFLSWGVSPRRIVGALGLVVAVALAGIVTLYLARNPERGTLDQSARASTTGSYAKLGDGVTHYETFGPPTAPVVVLVHGFSVPYYIWDSTVTPLRNAGYRVIRYDMYGRGYSDRPAVTYDSALFVRQLDQLLTALDVRTPVHLVGVSMGGWVTSSYVLAHRDRVRSLTLVDPVARTSSVDGVARVPIVGPLLWQATAVPKMAAGQLGDFVHPERFPDWDDRYVPQTRFKGFGRALLSTRRAMSTVDYDTLYGRVSRTGLPVLLVWGTEDATVPIGLSTRVRVAIPRLRFLPVDSAGHLPIVERASVVNRVLLRFLADTLPAGPVPP
jgi:pimeloyl-ACP methyl ester carboxylesterase